MMTREAGGSSPRIPDPALPRRRIRSCVALASNRLSRDSTLTGLSSKTYTYDDNDRLLSDRYDANGNTLTRGLKKGSLFRYKI